MKLRSIAFVVVLVAGMLAVEMSPAAAVDTGCISMDGHASGAEINSFEFFECGDDVLADEVATVTSEFGQATATASHRHSLTFAPPDNQGNVHISAAEAVGDASSSYSGRDTMSAGSGTDFDLEFEIPEGQTGSVNATISAETSGADPAPGSGNEWVEAKAGLRLKGPVHDDVVVEIVDEAPMTETDSLEAGDLPPGQYSVDADLGTDASAFDSPFDPHAIGASAHFDVEITVAGCDNEFTDGVDNITGTAGDDVLCGGDGNDVIEGGGGADTIHGGDGTDELSGNAGSDTIYGDLGGDIIGEVAGFNDGVLDTVHGCNDEQPLCNASQTALDAAGQSDNDIISVDSGGSLIHGGAARDTIIGGIGSDEIHGGPARDDIVGEEDFRDPEPGSPDLIEGDAGNDVIDAGPGNDEPVNGPWGVFGGPGNDTITGGFGDDRLMGGDGEDTIRGDLGNDTINGGPDFDVLQGCNFREQLCNVGDAELAAAGEVDEDIINGAGGRSLIDGNASIDWLIGGSDHDILDGGRGGDLLEGGGGRDTLIGDVGDDELKGQGGDESGPRIGQVVIRILGGPGDDEMFGGGGDDLLEAEDGEDVLAGEAGRDTLRGHGGEDCLAGGLGRDVFAGGGGSDKLVARDQTEDIVNGGPNFDRARVDGGLDNVIGVENRQLIEACAV